MTHLNSTRRGLLKGIAAGGASLTFAGYASAGDSDRYIVTARGEVDRRLERAGFTVRRSLADGDVLVVSGSGDPTDVRGVKEAVRDARFRFERPVERQPAEDPAAETEDESLYPLQWDKQVTNAAEAHETTTGDGATVAIIDTGTDLDHPDLAPNVTPGALFRRVAGRGDDVVDSLGDGLYAGVTEVRVPTQPELDPYAVTDYEGNIVGYEPAGFDEEQRDASEDVEGHGSHVSGIAAATVGEEVFPRFTGVAGMAPDATIVPHRVFYWELQKVTYEPTEGDEETDELVVTSTTTADILTAIDFAANELGVDAMNMSIGTPPLPPQLNRAGFRQAYRLVIQDAVNAGSFVAVSAGNSDTELNAGGVFTVPNSVPGATSIGATGPNDKRTFYSNYGANELSLAAPGGAYETLAKTLCTEDGIILGTCEEDEETGEVECEECEPPEWPFPYNLVLSTTPPDIYGAAYAYFAGTSMAAPQVAGAAALLAAETSLNPHQIETTLERTAETATGTDRRELGAGRLDAGAAVDDAVDSE
ncbi:MAG: subtilisin family serine protease [Natronomonas sp.]|jgi:subtilisin family serine protease